VATGADVVFFDLDGTLLAVNSGRLWLAHEYRRGRLSARDVALGLGYLAGYTLGVVDLGAVLRDASGTLEGLDAAALEAEIHRWYDEVVHPRRAARADALVERHRDAGHHLVLITTASQYEADRAAARFGLDEAYGTRFSVDGGRLGGGVERPVPYGEGKLTLATRLLRARGASLEAAWFYTDSITDLPLLQRVGNPRVVNPDGKLRRAARQLGYPVLDLRAQAG
jgi:HAD superfamily hydrolase (TIGR01490 family)